MTSFSCNNTCDFPQPELTCEPINIPYFVSQGYLVFVPDIHYQIGNSGQAAVIAVETAARYLKQHCAGWASGPSYCNTMKAVI